MHISAYSLSPVIVTCFLDISGSDSVIFLPRPPTEKSTYKTFVLAHSLEVSFHNPLAQMFWICGVANCGEEQVRSKDSKGERTEEPGVQRVWGPTTPCECLLQQPNDLHQTLPLKIPATLCNAKPSRGSGLQHRSPRGQSESKHSTPLFQPTGALLGVTSENNFKASSSWLSFKHLRAVGFMFMLNPSHWKHPYFLLLLPTMEFPKLACLQPENSLVSRVLSRMDGTVIYFKPTHLLIKPEIAFAFLRISSSQ